MEAKIGFDSNVMFTQGQYDAMLSLFYHTGEVFSIGTADRKFNVKDYFDNKQWEYYATALVLSGYQRNIRQGEAKIMMLGDYGRTKDRTVIKAEGIQRIRQLYPSRFDSNLAKEQAEYAKNDCAGLSVDVRVQDYRELNEKFDHVVSLGMFEHVGPKNHKAYMKVASRCLKDDGLFLLHTIGSNFTRHSPDPWFNKYIFPNGVLPSMKDITMAIDDEFIIEDYHSFGPDYDKTLMAWFDNFENGWKHLSKKYDEQHYKMWKYYLLCCAGAFRARNLQLWQFVLSKEGIAGGYTPIR